MASTAVQMSPPKIDQKDSDKKEASNADLEARVTSTLEAMHALCNDLAVRKKELDEKEEKWTAIEERMAANSAKFGNKIHLNIGGKRFTTTKATLMSQPSYFKSMLTSDHCQQDEDGEFFIDRNPKLFGIVLDYLRSGVLRTDDLTPQGKVDLKSDMEFYQIWSQGFGCADSVILSKAHQETMQRWFAFRKLERIYTASRDGFSALHFHARCDNKGATLLVIKTTENQVLGGYTSIPWKTSGDSAVSDFSAFLYIMSNPPKQVQVFSPSSAVTHGVSHARIGNLKLSSTPNQTPSVLQSFECKSCSYNGLFPISSFIAQEIEVFVVY